ncbi:flippase [uncultured Draconibacterium sp.]|uniref:flippase n=1 Tax=uncultured Draconibacterium sp. TaxID=1573823 RepID=UPI0032168E92
MRIKNTLNKYLNKLDIHTLEVVKKSSASTVVKVAGMAIGLGVSIFLGRTIGADGLGIINLSNRIVNIILVIGLLGMRQVIVKEVAIAHGKADNEHIGNVMHTAYLLNGITTVVLSVILILLTPWLANTVFKEPRLTYPLMIALVVMTPQVFSRIFSSGLIGYRKIWQSNLVEQTLSIGATGLLLGLLWLLKKDITINIVAIGYAMGRIAVTISVGIYWNSISKQKKKGNLILKQILGTSIPLFIVSISEMIFKNMDVLLLGTFCDSRKVGLYSVAARLALLTSFFLFVSNSVLSPKIASLYNERKFKELEKMIKHTNKGLLLLAIFIILFFIIFGKWLLSLWGNEFIEGYFVLIVLGVGQFVNLATGSVGIILIMTGHEKIQRNISIVFMLIFVFLNYLLIKTYGITGAAIATSFVIIGMNITKYIYVKRTVKIKIY